MSCNNCISPKKTSIFNTKTVKKEIKFNCSATGNKLAVLEDDRAKSNLELCDVSFTYEQAISGSMILEPNAINREINYPNNIISFIALKVTYKPISSTCCSPNDDNYINYTFYNKPNDIRNINNFMILTGDIPKIFLSNPSEKYNVLVEYITSTDSLEYIENDIVYIGDNVLSIENLVYTDITSDINNIYVKDLTIRWIDIQFNDTNGDIVLNNSIVTIHDYVQGTINLIFVDNFNASQCYSLLKWAINTENIIDNNPIDDQAPIIEYISPFINEIIYTDPITKDDLFNMLVVGISDNRDINIDFTYNNMTIRNINSINYIDVIDSIGHYFIEFTVSDNAGNIRTESFIINIKDDQAPKLILNDFGLELYNVYSTSSLVPIILEENSYIILNDIVEVDVEFNSTGGFGYIIIEDDIYEVRIVDGDFIFDYQINPIICTLNVGIIFNNYTLTLIDNYILKIVNNI